MLGGSWTRSCSAFVVSSAHPSAAKSSANLRTSRNSCRRILSASDMPVPLARPFFFFSRDRMASVFCTTARRSDTATRYRSVTRSATRDTSQADFDRPSPSSSSSSSNCSLSGVRIDWTKARAVLGGAFPVMLYRCLMRGTSVTRFLVHARAILRAATSRARAPARSSSPITPLRPEVTISVASVLFFSASPPAPPSWPPHTQPTMVPGSECRTLLHSAWMSFSTAMTSRREEASADDHLPPPPACVLAVLLFRSCFGGDKPALSRGGGGPSPKLTHDAYCLSSCKVALKKRCVRRSTHTSSRQQRSTPVHTARVALRASGEDDGGDILLSWSVRDGGDRTASSRALRASWNLSWKYTGRFHLSSNWARAGVSAKVLALASSGQRASRPDTSRLPAL
mmetsp:Transcript_23190/g.45222  ORF Transcript_23190/g.45222 Transcript_23190/m.45222 type:complete len:397 (-) Transcript_23190:864-2054(-)